MAKSQTRDRKKPERYGKRISNIDLSSSTEEDQYADNSMDEETYEPPNKKNKKGEEHTDSDDETSEHEVSSTSIPNFNEDFNQIQMTNSPDKKVTHKEKSCNCNDNSYLRKIFENTQSILKRIEVIEESLIKNGTLVTIKTEMKQNVFEKYHQFIEQNGFPIKHLDDLKKYERKLCDENFQNEMVSILIINFYAILILYLLDIFLMVQHFNGIF